MKVKFKKLTDKVVTPVYSSSQAAGIDFYAHTIRYVYEESKHNYSLDKLKFIEYDTCIAVEIPEGYVGLIFPRSSISNKDLILSNSVGMIDSDYRGSIKFRFKKTHMYGLEEYKVGDKVGQLLIVPYPKIELEEADDLSDTIRGSGGYGSTGR